MRKQELLDRIERLEEEQERLRRELAEHKLFDGVKFMPATVPVPVIPYMPYRPWPVWPDPLKPTWICDGTHITNTDTVIGYPAGTQGSITTMQ